MNTVTDIPMTNPDIITGISLMLMFVFVGRLFGASTSLSFLTMLIAHVTFCTPYIILQVLPKLQQMDKALPEAAMDLGCTPMRAFWKVEIPEILPGIITGAIMAFTLSLDDFVISYFTSGNGFETLPIRIYGMTKKNRQSQNVRPGDHHFLRDPHAAAHQQRRGQRREPIAPGRPQKAGKGRRAPAAEQE